MKLKVRTGELEDLGGGMCIYPTVESVEVDGVEVSNNLRSLTIKCSADEPLVVATLELIGIELDFDGYVVRPKDSPNEHDTAALDSEDEFRG